MGSGRRNLDAVKAIGLIVGIVFVATMVGQATALACSTVGALTLDEILELDEDLRGDTLAGFHEQRHIARIPKMPFLVNERSASVVVRYWGEAPNLSVASHGDEGIFLQTSTSCGSPARPNGFVATQANSAGSLEYPRWSGSNIMLEYGPSPSAAEVAKIESRFGAAVEVSLGLDDYVVAYALLLWRPLVVFGTLGAIAFGLTRRAGKTKPAQTHLNRPTLAAAAIGVTAIASATPSYGIIDWLGLLAALAGSVLLGWTMRVPWTAFSVGYAAYFSYLPDPLFRPVSWEWDRRLQTAVGALIIGAGVLVWARGHWTRFVSSFMVVSGAFFFVLGSADVRSYDNTGVAVVVAAIVAAATAAAVWRLVFRDPGEAPSGSPATAEELSHP